MPHSLAILDSNRHSMHDAVDRSSLPHSEKTAIRRFYEKMGGHVSRASHQISHGASQASSMLNKAGAAIGLGPSTVVKATHVLRAGGEAIVVGAALGAIDQKNGGLDVTVPIGSGYKLPVDAVTGGVAFLASMVGALEPVSEDLNRIGVIGTASFAARKTKEWMSGAAAGGGSNVGGEFAGEDEVLAWAAKQG
jgi:hypothetical protein